MCRLFYCRRELAKQFWRDYTRGGRFTINVLGSTLEDTHERLASVIWENLDWQAFIDRYDYPCTLYYIDPPYWGTEDYYGKDLFPRDQFAQLAERLRHIEAALSCPSTTCRKSATCSQALPCRKWA